jgi:hypothetical protein
MAPRPSIAIIVLSALLSLGATYRTPNFVVDAPTPALAQQVGQYAEHYRREKALQWLGQEMPTWGQPCPLKVTVTNNGSGGATSFAFDQGAILSIEMNIEGTPERLLNSVLPHEVTHTVFAHYFRCPVPRWADEGGSVLSEDDIERNRHDRLVRQILNTPGRMIPLRRLMSLMKYPNDVMVLYAEGYSVTSYLVGISSRPAFLAFVAHGMRHGWDSALQQHYQINSVEELEQRWLSHLRQTRPGQTQPPATVLASGRDPRTNDKIVVRQTAPPAPPLTDSAARPVFRGQMPAGDEPLTVPGAGQPLFLPEAPRGSSGGWQSPPAASQDSGVRLGPPQFEAAPTPPVQLGQPIGNRSPVGLSR